MNKLLHLLMRMKIIGAGRRSLKTRTVLADLYVSSKITDALGQWISRKGYRETDKNIDGLAAELNVDKQQLAHYFKHVMGTSFTQWRKHLRIEEAKILLAQTDLSCAEIGCLVGFADKSNFRKRFEGVTGMTPQQWRIVNGGRTAGKDRTPSMERRFRQE